MEFNYWYYHYSIYSEAVHKFDPPQDWTAKGEMALELYFHGQKDNSTAQMYLVLDDEDSETIISYPGDANDLKIAAWQVWRIALNELNDPNLNLSHITSIALGFCAEAGQPFSTGGGKVYFDDIRLYSSRCLQEYHPNADFNGDCIVNYKDMEEMAFYWLDSGYNIYSVTAPNNPILWYTFDGNMKDSVSGAEGRIRGDPNFAPGVFGQAIRFDGFEDAVEITNASSLFSKIVTGITIAFWQYGTNSTHHSDTLCCSNFIYGLDDPAIAINLGCWRQPGRRRSFLGPLDLRYLTNWLVESQGECPNWPPALPPWRRNIEK